MIADLEKVVVWDLTEEYSDVRYFDTTDMIHTIEYIYHAKKIPFVLLLMSGIVSSGKDRNFAY